jgi:hypothetical protein
MEQMQGLSTEMKKRMDRSGWTVFILAVGSFILGIIAAS